MWWLVIGIASIGVWYLGIKTLVEEIKKEYTWNGIPKKKKI